MTSFKQITQARWFPTLTKPILSGLLASGIIYGLHALGITSVLPWEVNNAVTPLVGFLVTAVAQRPGQVPAPTPSDSPSPEPTPSPAPRSLGQSVAQMLLDDVTQAIDADPAFRQQVLAKTLELVANPLRPTAPAPEVVVTTGNEAIHTN